jgi:hypothetical protein
MGLTALRRGRHMLQERERERERERGFVGSFYIEEEGWVAFVGSRRPFGGVFSSEQ